MPLYLCREIDLLRELDFEGFEVSLVKKSGLGYGDADVTDCCCFFVILMPMLALLILRIEDGEVGTSSSAADCWALV